MGVDHSIVMGYGLLLPPNLERDEEKFPDGVEEWLYQKLPEGFTHITAGSYYETAAVEHALVFSGTQRSEDDLSGWLKTDAQPVITISQKIQMRRLYQELTGVEPIEQPEFKWHVGGLWH